MVSLFFRNLLFTILQPGLVAGYVPYLILGRLKRNSAFSEFGITQGIGLALFVLGFIIMIHCITFFAIKGRGTLSPADPTKKLVVSGLYKFSRNPMYVGVMSMLIGEAIFFNSFDLWIYSALIFVAFNLFISFVEEPRLKRDFGEEYLSYRQKVRKWF